VATLFEIWLIACNKVFPSPSLWKTFQELCSNWRHHVSLVVEWNRVCIALTNRLLELIWWPDLATANVKNQASTDTNVAYDIQTIINSMSVEVVLQAWFRFLHIIGRPIDFCDIMVSFFFLFFFFNYFNFIDCFLVFNNNEFFKSIIKTPEFIKVTLMQKEIDQMSGFSNFSCIRKLPVIYLETIKGISRIVDSFLGYFNVSSR
jgi:hypothetical protein